MHGRPTCILDAAAFIQLNANMSNETSSTMSNGAAVTTACTHNGSILQSKPFSRRCNLDQNHHWIMAMYINLEQSARPQCLLCSTAGASHKSQASQICLRYVSAGKWPSVRARSKAYRVSSMAMSSAWHSKACWQRGSAATMAVSGSTSPAMHNNCHVCCKGT